MATKESSDPDIPPSTAPSPSTLPHPVAAVSLKLPPYWPNDPALWFAQVEAQFATRGITVPETKFAYVVSSLQPEIAQEVRDLLIDPPKTERYKTLKAELVRRTSTSEQKKLHQLLISEELGDRKPSQLLRRMKQLLGDGKLEERILKQLFLQRLPQTVQLILASTSDAVNIEQLADIADKIVEAAIPPVSSIATVSTHPQVAAAAAVPPPVPPSEIQQLQMQVQQLTLQVQQLSSNMTERGREQRRRNGRDNPQRQSRSPSTQRHAAGECWYHWRFGKQAKKCIQPCTFQQFSSTHDQGNGQTSH